MHKQNSTQKPSSHYSPHQSIQFEIHEARTPRTKKSQTINQTPLKYMQLQLQVSQKKRQNTERLLAQRQRRIQHLEGQIKENQSLVAETLQKWKEQEQEMKKEKRQNDAIQESYNLMLQKFQKLEAKSSHFAQIELQNQEITRENIRLKEENEHMRKEKSSLELKYQELKKLRKKQKQEWRHLLPEFMEQFNKVKAQFLKIEHHNSTSFTIEQEK